MTFRHQDRDKVVISLVDRPGEVVGRRPCPETEIIARCVLDRGAGAVSRSLGEKPGFTPVEAAVALNKHLHLQVFSKSQGKWLFTEMRTVRPLVAELVGSLELRLSSYSNPRLTRSAILLDGQELGYMCFSLKS
jgi:hypothetical protein